tara:strand:- start:1293 stop:1553 length:261 start_codon:yes stop_codon:yes gene_type:complete
MKKVLLAVTVMSAMLTSACGFTPIYEPGEPAFDFVGCHTVKVNPSTTGERAFIAMFDLNVGDNLYFKQVSPDGKTVGPVTTGEPCK